MEDNVRLLVLVGTHTEVLDALSAVLLSSEQERATSSRLPQRKLIERQTFTSSSENPGSRSLRESKGGDRELGALIESDVVGDGGDADDG